MEDLTGKFDNLFDKVETLMVKYARANEENRRLAEENEKLRAQKKERDETIRTLDHKIGVLKTAGSVGGNPEDKAEIRQKVNEYIREIDRCIAMLNS